MKTPLVIGAVALTFFIGAVIANAQTELRLEATQSSETGSASETSSTETSVTTGEGGQEASVDYFLKIEGVEGESSEKKGNVEHEWKVEEGESAEGKESGEKGGTEDINIGVGEMQGRVNKVDSLTVKQSVVSVNAVEVRGWDTEKKQEFMATVKAHAEVQSGQELENFARGVLLENEAMEEISLNFEKIQVRHRAKGKLFGFIPFSYTERVEVDAEGEDAGRVKVQMPWYSFFIKPDVPPAEVESEASAALSANLGGNENWDFGARAEALLRVADILRTKHETAMNSVRNVK